jgi:antirestriction protein
MILADCGLVNRIPVKKLLIVKDFLSHYDYLNFKDKNDFNQEHPMIQEANLISDIESIAIKFDKRLSGYVAVLSDIEKTNQEALFVSKPIKEWVDLLNFPDKTKNYFYGKFQTNKEPTIDEFKEVLNDYANSIKEFEINKILDNDAKKEIYKNIKKVRVYFDEVVENILTKIYSSQLEDKDGTSLDISRFFNKRDIATFHTTLKESIVIDCRLQNDIVINEAAKKLLNDDKLKTLTNVLCQSKYHDYIEIDKDIFDKESVLTVDDIINLIEKTNSFNLPVNIKTALKFRKLKQYKATGIYFSFSKQLGLDFRDGFGAYMHEVAHHIDLSSENYNRNCMVNYLYEYFCNKITDRVDYYLKSEELIARAAEIF